MVNHPNRRNTPRRRFFTFAEAHGITIEHERSTHGPYHHVTAYAPEGQQFSGNRLDLVSLWDGLAPDWGECLADLRDNMMPLEPAGAE